MSDGYEESSVALPEKRSSGANWLKRLYDSVEAVKLDPSVMSEVKAVLEENGKHYKAGGNKLRIPVVRNKSDLIALQEENSRCLAQRDRVTELLVSYMETFSQLQVAYTQAEARVVDSNDYATLRNAQQRELYVIRMLKPLVKKKQEVEQAIEICKETQRSLTTTLYAIQHQSEMGIAILKQTSA